MSDTWICPDQTNHVPGGHSDCAGERAKVAGGCDSRPCVAELAIVSGCTCGLYLCSIRRRIGHHTTDCGILKENR